MKSKYDILFSKEEKEKMKDEYIKGCSILDISKKYNIKSKDWICKKLLNGVTRNYSESSILSHKKYPNSFKHTEEYKKRMSEIRLNYMKEHPEETAWRKRNEPSYPEKCFIKFLKEYEYDKKYLIEREKSIFPYYIDFAFVNEKLAIEIDGSQHLEEERKKSDEKKDNLLISKGWKVLRISENIVKSDWKILNEKLEKFLSKNTINYEKIGIVLPIKGKIKISKNGKTYKSYYIKKENKKHYYKVSPEIKPSLEELMEMKETMSNIAIGKKYNVSETCIRKWIKNYKKLGSYKG